jgi:hypothetical protein
VETATLPLLVTVTAKVGVPGVAALPKFKAAELSEIAGVMVPVPLKFKVAEVLAAVTVMELLVVVVSVGA